MKSSNLMSLSFVRRIQLLAWGKWVLWLGPWLIALKVYGWRPGFFMVGMAGAISFVALRAWETSQRRQFIRESRFPSVLFTKLCEAYPQLSRSDADLVLRGLRQFFLAHLRSDRKFVAMPSKLADEAWHAFILHTRAYEDWCNAAFGKLMHHTPAEVLGKDPKRNDGLRRAWYWSCKEESINPRSPSRLPLLFALDKKYAIAGGFAYVPDCRDIDRQSGSDAYCGTSFSSSASDGGASGDASGFGGCEAGSGGGDSGSTDGGSDGGSCGGGCGGGGD